MTKPADFGPITNEDYRKIAEAALADKKIQVNGKEFDGTRQVTEKEFMQLYKQVQNPDARSQALMGYLTFPTDLNLATSVDRLVKNGPLTEADRMIGDAGQRQMKALDGGKSVKQAYIGACMDANLSFSMGEKGSSCTIPNATNGKSGAAR
jgi:hypothetical protein